MQQTTKPSNQQVRSWMQQRQEQNGPPPSPEEIRRQLGWRMVEAEREAIGLGNEIRRRIGRGKKREMSMAMIDISKLSKPQVLAALFNASRQQGMGFLDTRGARSMSEEDAAKVIADQGLYFDYLRGRVMKVGLDGDQLDPYLYDRDNGAGAAARALAPLLSA
ncbi:hypothetical protein [Massilia phyllosphaerae]|uniref:hypothetical protein n=1 Tax=Massilia phyllosphaerae TaxID=3106034 RepID=UPI002B1CBAE6|nr:hypothetical protein [Massilia sp. SGZ-792]